MPPPLQALVQILKWLFNYIYNQIMTEKIECRPEGHNFVIPFKEEKSRININGRMTFMHGHWTTKPFSSLLRVENLPVQLSSGTGLVDLIVLIVPIRRNPRIYEKYVEINEIRKFHGTEISDFEREFRKSFVTIWNRRKS